MVLMNRFAGQPWRHRHKEQTCGQEGWGKERLGPMERGAWKHTPPHVRESVGICCMRQGTHTGAL